MGSLQLTFFIRVEPPPDLLIYVVVCYGVCFLLSGAILDGIVPIGTQPLGFAPLQAFGAYPLQAYMHPGDGHQPMPLMH